VAQRGRVVLNVVVQGPPDEPDAPGGAGAQRDPVVVVVAELRRRERQRDVQQLAPCDRRRAADAVGDQQRQQVLMVVAAAAPVRRRDELPLAIDHAGVGVHEQGAPDLGQRGGELVRMPVVILVGHRDKRGVAGGQRQRALEVAVEAKPGRGSAEQESAIAAGRVPQPLVVLGGGAVVADHAQPVGVRLGAD